VCRAETPSGGTTLPEGDGTPEIAQGPLQLWHWPAPAQTLPRLAQMRQASIATGLEKNEGNGLFYKR